MTDIVERLRLQKSCAAWYCDETDATLEDAAGEIERLRAERAEAVAALALYRAENGCTRGQRTTQWCGEATRLREALKACADDLEAEVCARYAGTQDLYPSERRRFDRDMEAVTAARQLLAGSTS
jgi:hypothetical protein